ncbi:PstS family phosphate ABC transporter substrate-binding protein [Virgibacillus halophilus]|uniref:PstS family phosphate ABC transporter substrate-binding protein n=1 Tax=Tigheibacillus halophilus TaxID=361280 RepID=UPI003640A12D
MKGKVFITGLLLAAIVIMTACSSATNEDGTEAAAKKNNNAQEALEGSVTIDGSGTVYPLMARLAEEYMSTKAENVSVEVSRSGTGAGFKKFLTAGGTDFNDASRKIKDEEAEEAKKQNINYREIKVALDGLTFVTSKDNNWANEMTAEDLKKIFLADSKVTKWSDINPKWPNEKINTYGPNENHGTYEFFYENILEEKDLVSNINLQQDYSTLVKLVSEDKNAIAFFGFGYYATNKEKVQAVAVDFGKGSIVPSLDSIAEDGDYADFTRPVFTYLNVNAAKEKPQVLDYSQYVVEHANKFAGETGFAPITDNEVQENLAFLRELQNE